MKIRADFVTNSSSSCYVTITIETTDGHSYQGSFDGDEIGYSYIDNYISSHQPDEEKIKKICCAQNGNDLLDIINEMYHGMFSNYEQFDSLFGTDQEEVQMLSKDKMKKVTINELIDDDEGSSTAVLTCDFKTGENTYQRSFGVETERPVEDLEEIMRDCTLQEILNATDEITTPIRDPAYYNRVQNKGRSYFCHNGICSQHTQSI